VFYDAFASRRLSTTLEDQLVKGDGTTRFLADKRAAVAAVDVV
jgi:hypothetical protein